MEYKDFLLKHKKKSIVILILLLSTISLYLDKWFHVSFPQMGEKPSIVLNLDVDFQLTFLKIYEESYKNSDIQLSYEDIKKLYENYLKEASVKIPDTSGFTKALWCLRLYQLLIIVGLVLLIKDEEKYDKIIEIILGVAGILGILVVFLFIRSNANSFIDDLNNQLKNNTNDPSNGTSTAAPKIDNPSMSVSSYLMLISSIGCLTYTGLCYTKKI
jgi:hypothetical protein